MRLSEAIRLGATMCEQGFGSFFHGNKACAIGSAMLAIGIKDPKLSLDIWPILHSMTPRELGGTVLCPVCGKVPSALGAIPHLNDRHGWTRERIADWVELQEGLPVEAEEPQPQEAQV